MSMPTAVFSVSGMTCGHCVSAVTTELSALPGVSGVRVDLQPGQVSLVEVDSAMPLELEIVRAAVDEAGYVLEG
jgi:copper chaperone